MDIVIIEEKDNSNNNNENNQTYIKSQGMSQTIIQKPGVNSNVNQINWDANHNGQVANLNLDVNTNGKKDNYVLQLTKGDLENLLNVPSVEKPLEERLEDDFLISDSFIPRVQYKPQPYLFRTSIYPKLKDHENQSSVIEKQINNELSKMTTQDEESLKSEIKNLIQLKKKLQHPHKGKHNHSHYKSQHHIPHHNTRKKMHMSPLVKHHHLTSTTKTKKKKEYKTPSPKTIRIHLTDDHNVSSATSSSSSSSKKRKSRKKTKTSSPKKDPSLLERISNLIQN
jgi:hypothetical protein